MKGGIQLEFDELYQSYFKDIYRYVYSLSKNESISEEITQETFYKALRSINSFDGEKDIRAWLFTIAKNTYYSYCRKNNRLIEEDSLTKTQNDVSFVDKLIDEERTFLIHQFLHSMDEPYKEVFSLRVFGELPFEKIGALFGKSSGWARVVFHRAKRKIVEYVEGKENEKK